jgi:hypothetical protein
MSRILNIVQNDTKSHYRKQLNEAKRLVKKWNQTGLLEGIKTRYEKYGMAIMLENQARQLIDEVSKTGGQSSEEWSSVALPLVRRIFAEIAAKDFVSIQPMSLPSGLVFYIDFKYGTEQPGFNTTEGVSKQGNSIYGITNQIGDATEGLYGAGRFGYSINDYTNAVTFTTGSVTISDVDFNYALSGSLASLTKVTADFTNLNHDKQGVRAFLISGTGINTYYPTHTKPVDALGALSTSKVTFVVYATGSFGSTVTVKYHKQPLDYTRGDFEATGDPSWGDGQYGPDKYNPTTVGANAIDIPEIDIDFTSIPIVAKTRKLKAVWTPELSQDLNAYHSIDAESELTSIMSEYISMEIDLEILDMLRINANITNVWSARIGHVWNGTTFTTQDNEQGRTLAYTQPTWFQTLGVKMQDVSNRIHQKTMRGGANFAVTSPNVATIIESMPGYSSDNDGSSWGTNSFAMGVQKVGALNNRYNIFKVPYWKENTILMGFRGSQFLETGAVYSPFVPLIMTPVVFDSVNLTPRKGVMTRYAKVVTRPEFFGMVQVADLNYV